MANERLGYYVEAFEVIDSLLCEGCRVNVQEYLARLKGAKIRKIRDEILTL